MEADFHRRELKTMMIYNNSPLMRHIPNVSRSGKDTIYTFPNTTPENDDCCKTTPNKNAEEKNRNPGFTSMLSLMRITFSSSQIEGRCFRNNSETKPGEQTVSPKKGLNARFGTQEELPYICNPSRRTN